MMRLSDICTLQIVPPNQAVLMYEKVVEKGLPSTLVMFEGNNNTGIKPGTMLSYNSPAQSLLSV